MIKITKEEKYVWVDIDLAEANLSNADQFKAGIIALLDEKKTSLVLNMAKVAYVDSSFLGALVAALKHAIAMKLNVVLVSLQPDIEDLLKLIRLDKVFKIYSSNSDAQSALK